MGHRDPMTVRQTARTHTHIPPCAPHTHLCSPLVRALDTPLRRLSHCCSRCATPFSSLAKIHSSAMSSSWTAPPHTPPAVPEHCIPPHSHPLPGVLGTSPDSQKECLPNPAPPTPTHLSGPPMMPFGGLPSLRAHLIRGDQKERQPEQQGHHISEASLGSRVDSRAGGPGQSLWREWEHPTFPHLNRTISQT